MTASDLISRWSGMEVVVVGDVMLDVWLHGAAHRLCREAPVPVLDVEQRFDVPGGAANVAVNIGSLGAHPRLVSVMGDDDGSSRLRRALESGAVGCSDIITDPRRTT